MTTGRSSQVQQFKYILYHQSDTGRHFQIYFETVCHLHNCVLPLLTNNTEMCRTETQINNENLLPLSESFLLLNNKQTTVTLNSKTKLL